MQKLIDRLKLVRSNINSRDSKTVYYLMVLIQYLSMSLTITSYVLFLLSHGLSPLQANLINAMFMLGNFLFEVPTGVYADYFGRKKSIMLFFSVWSLSHFIYFFSGSFAGFILAELTAALGVTFITGALDAWLIDAVGEREFVGKIDYILSQAQVYGKVTFVLGGLLGSYIAKYNLALPFLAEGIISLFGLGLAWVFIEEDFIKPKMISISKGIADMKTIVKDSLIFLRQQPIVKWLILTTIITWTAFQPLNMFWSPRFTQMGQVDVSMMGKIWVAFSLAMMLGSWLLRKMIEGKKSYSLMAYLSIILLAVPAIISGLLPYFWPAITFFVIYEVGRGMEKSFKSAYLNRYIPSDKRATLLSFNGMLGRLGAAIGLVMFGWIANNYGFGASWVIAGLLLLLILPIFFHIKKIT